MKSLYFLPKLSLALLIPAGFAMHNLHASAAIAQTQPMLGIDAARIEIVKAAINVIKSNKPGARELTVTLFNSIQKRKIQPITEEAIVETAESKAAALAQLQSDLHKLNEKEIVQFTLELKEEFIQNLSLEHKVHIFIHLSEILLGKDEKPFKTQLSQVTQFQTFILILTTLLENESQFKNLVACFQQCVLIKNGNVWQVRARLQDVDTKLLPTKIAEFLDKNLFNPRLAGAITQRIKHLMLH